MNTSAPGMTPGSPPPAPLTKLGPGLKYDDGKLAVDLLPIRALVEVAKVVTFGAAKYSANNWQNVKPRRRYFAAAMRHLWDRALGKKTDKDSGLPHLAHAACDILFLLAFEVGFDDPDAFETTVTSDEYCPVCEHAFCQCSQKHLETSSQLPIWPPSVNDLVWVRYGGMAGKRATVLRVLDGGFEVRFSAGAVAWYQIPELSPVPIEAP